MPLAGGRALAGDLDCIVLKALRKDASDRYSSVEQFSDDIERYLCGLPVQATRHTAAYHAVKFVKRHTAGVIAALVSVCGLAVGLVAALSVRRRYAGAGAKRIGSAPRSRRI